MEEEYANAPEGSFDPQSISSVKIALMGPLAGIGDSFFWGTFRVIACGIGAPLAAAGNLLGVVLYLLLNLIPSTLTRVYGFKLGYQGGREFLAKIQADGTLEKVTEATKILGLVVIGGLVPTIVAVPVSLQLNMGGGSFILAEVLNSIMPNLLPLVLSVIVYHYIQKGVSVNKLLFILLGLGILLTAVGFFPMG
ncbi:MAG: PTS system mannose/fructose/sorbose family transporter subunit IID [Holdemania massiliensis]